MYWIDLKAQHYYRVGQFFFWLMLSAHADSLSLRILKECVKRGLLDGVMRWSVSLFDG